MTDWVLTTEEREEACKGKLCPSCKGIDIKWAGSAPDGMYTNTGYNCQNKRCGRKWEGY